LAYNWPGNVRELENAIERAVALSSGTVLTADDLDSIPNGALAERLPDCNEMVPLEELERRAIFHAIRETGGDKLAAADLLRIGKTTLYRKLLRYGLDGPDGPRFRALSVSKEDSEVEAFLMCVHPNCRRLINLEEERKLVADPDDLPRDCPECGHFLSRFCPFCKQPLYVHWRGDIPPCKQCDGQLTEGDA
jgi:Bacterial regulatory protein, Fis family